MNRPLPWAGFTTLVKSSPCGADVTTMCTLNPELSHFSEAFRAISVAVLALFASH